MGKSGLLFYDTSGWSLLRKSYTKSAFGSMYCDSKTDRSYCANRVSSRHVLEDLGTFFYSIHRTLLQPDIDRIYGALEILYTTRLY